MKLTDSERSFILHWGEMGSRWGVNRAVAQVHALLLVSENAINAQDIADTLNLARSNVSTALRDLQAWKIIKLVHLMGDRREHFEADKDVWRMLSQIAEKRIEHEVVPTITLLKSLQGAGNNSKEFDLLLEQFVEVFESSTSFFHKLKRFPIRLVKKLLKFDKKMEQLFGSHQ